MPGSHLALLARCRDDLLLPVFAVLNRTGNLRQAAACDLSIDGPEGIRTPDLLNAIETRSQLRYRPASAQIIHDCVVPASQPSVQVH